jgi:hypothetical protein
MGEALGQQLIVENVGGAGGTIGVTKVACAAPDGYTLAQSWDAAPQGISQTGDGHAVATRRRLIALQQRVPLTWGDAALDRPHRHRPPPWSVLPVWNEPLHRGVIQAV